MPLEWFSSLSVSELDVDGRLDSHGINQGGQCGPQMEQYHPHYIELFLEPVILLMYVCWSISLKAGPIVWNLMSWGSGSLLLLSRGCWCC